MLSDFLGAQAPNTTGCLLGPWEVIGKESCDLECVCLYVHFDTVLTFTRNEQMRCLDAFRGNANGDKHMRNVTSHVGTPRNVSGENMTRPREVQKRRKNNLYTLSEFPRARATDATECLLAT